MRGRWRCALARPLLVAAAFGGRRPRRPAAGHAARCLSCRAAALRARSAQRGLRSLGAMLEPGPPGLAGSVLARIGAQEPDRPVRRRGAGWIPAAAAVAAGSAVLMVVRLRRALPAG